MARGKKIIDGLVDAIAFAKGDKRRGRVTRFTVPDDVDVRAIRKQLGLSQAEFALRFGFPLGTLRHWEQGLRHPEGSARAFLTVIRHNPKMVVETLEKAASRQSPTR